MSHKKYPNYYKYFKWNNFDPFVLIPKRQGRDPLFLKEQNQRSSIEAWLQLPPIANNRICDKS